MVLISIRSATATFCMGALVTSKCVSVIFIFLCILRMFS